MTRPRMLEGWPGVSALLFLSACAATPSAPAPAPRAPAPAVEPAVEPAAAAPRLSLAPPDAAARTADRVSLNGRELGTMWTFENPPLDYWRSEYDFTASPEWLEHVRLASVRYGEYCSASFVSGDGLVMTNHHCARECVEANSGPAADHLVTGFLAAERADERICPGLFLDQLVAIEDVTARVRAAAAAGRTDAEIADAVGRMSEQVEGECEARTGATCQVVSLFQGGQYQLYQYRRYEPVKLVFAPELQAGFYGGDPDNFTYPRWALDVSFVRAYESDGSTPARTPHYFRWHADGAKEGELVFVTGNPGSTSRLATVSQVLYERVYRHPFLSQLLGGQRELLKAFAAANPQAESDIRQDLFEVENSLKSYLGQLAGLRDTLLVGTKIRWEREFRDRIAADPKARDEFGDVWDRIEDIQRQKLEVSPPLNVTNPQLIGGPHLGYAAQLVAYVRAMALPEAQRAEPFRGPAAQQQRAALEAPSAVADAFATLLLRLHLEIAHAWLSPADPLFARLFRTGETAAQAANRMASASRILDAAFRSEILQGGVAALDASTDPLLAFVREAVARNPGLTERWQEIQAAEAVQKQRLAQALFVAYGTSLPPDATFTLRITDGRVARYEYNGTFAPPVTTFYGLYGRAAEFANEMPWSLPAAFAAAKDRIALATPLNFVTTNDITGGNSGSPMIDRDARIVGLAFDGNIEQLPNEFLFRPGSGGRTVGVHSAGILEALRSVYGAQGLVRELLGEIAPAEGARR